MKWNINKRSDGVVEIYSFFQEEGPIIYCHKNGDIELWDSTAYGSGEHFCGKYDNLFDAMTEGETFT
jgi:hypothetical protein